MIKKKKTEKWSKWNNSSVIYFRHFTVIYICLQTLLLYSVNLRGKYSTWGLYWLLIIKTISYMTSQQERSFQNNSGQFLPRFVAWISIVKNTFNVDASKLHVIDDSKMADYKRWSYSRNVRFNGKRVQLFSLWKVKVKNQGIDIPQSRREREGEFLNIGSLNWMNAARHVKHVPTVNIARIQWAIGLISENKINLHC